MRVYAKYINRVKNHTLELLICSVSGYFEARLKVKKHKTNLSLPITV